MRAQLAVNSYNRIEIETVRIDDTGVEEIISIYRTDIDAEAPIEEIYQSATKRLAQLGYQAGPWRPYGGAGHVADIEALPSNMTVRAYHRATDIVKHNHEIQDGDIVLLPDPGPSQGLLAIKAEHNGEMRIRKLTRALDEVLDSYTVEEDYEVLTQPRYVRSVTGALAIVNQANDTIIPYYNPRFRLLDHYIPGRTRDREQYGHSVVMRTLPPGSSQVLEVLQVWYGEELAPGNFVGLVFSSLPGDQEQQTWSPTHSGGLHSGVSLGRFSQPDQAISELIRFDLAATCAEAPPPRPIIPEHWRGPGLPTQDTAEPVSYEPNLED